jgi:hypothetical protein
MCKALSSNTSSSKIKTKQLNAVIIATQEAAIRRITFQSQTGQIAGEGLSQKNPIQRGLMKLLQV